MSESFSQTQQIFPFSITTNKRKRQSEADYTKQNPLRIPMYVNGLELTMDAEFQQKGQVLIFIDGTRRFDSTDEANSLKGHLKYVIPLGVLLPRDKKIEVYAYNEKDDNSITCNFNLFLDEVQKSIPSESTPLDKTAFNKLVSEADELFPFKIYSDEEPTALLHMEGHEHILLTMSGSTIPPVTEETPADTSSLTPTSGLKYDFTQTPTTFNVTALPDLTGLGDTYDIFQVVDLGRSIAQSLTFDVDKKLTEVVKSVTHYDSCSASTCDGSFQERHINQDKVVTYDVDESDDPTFATGVTNIETGVSDVTSPLLTTKRYLRITEHITTSYSNEKGADTGFQNNNGHGQPDLDADFTPAKTPSVFTNWLDGLSVGGQAEMSLEILGSGNQWFELVTAEEMGAVTAGAKILVEIGDTLIKKHRIPSTQTHLRAKLKVTNSIETGVSIIKVG